MSEESAVITEIERSQAQGTLTDRLARLVHRIARRRCPPQMAEDIGQSVLLALLKHLPGIDPPTSHAYICMCVVLAWRYWLRGRRVERRYMVSEFEELVKQIPPQEQPHAWRRAWRSILMLKYY